MRPTPAVIYCARLHCARLHSASLHCAVLAACALLAAACEGTAGDVFVTRAPGGGAPGEACAAELYLIGADFRLAVARLAMAGVDPPGRPQPVTPVELVTLACAPRRTCADGSAAPISMTIDRRGVAWLATCAGELLRADLRTGQCDTTAVDPDATGLEHFTVAALSDARGESMVVAGPASTPAPVARTRPGPATFGALQPPAMQLEPLGALPGWPSLAATPAGELWAYFPHTGVTAPRVAQLDPRTGAELRPLPMPPPVYGLDPPPFAAAGGDLWLFQSAPRTAVTTVVHRLSRADGALLGTAVIPRRAVSAAAAVPCAVSEP